MFSRSIDCNGIYECDSYRESDEADVECVTIITVLLAFRLSPHSLEYRDFKVRQCTLEAETMRWSVCPVYQLLWSNISTPDDVSVYCDIYAFSSACTLPSTQSDACREVFRTVEAMHPSKNANSYWQAVNRTFLDFDDVIGRIWQEETRFKRVYFVSKKEALNAFAERERILRLSRDEAISEVLEGK